ncbi:MAG: NYN domain-containing protein, partial [bacterium]|nr:NYN domain-containing protein [bacterium]
DVQNIFYAAKQFNARLDFEKLLQVAVGKRRLIRAIAYVVQSPEVDQSGFISMLQQKGYEVRQKDLRTRSDGSAKGDWDMGMAIDIMGLVDKLDVVSIVTGDGDFVSLLHLVKTIGPRVEVISFVHNTARDLVQSADLHIPIEETLLMRPDSNGSYNKQTPRAEAQPLDRSEKPEKIEKTEPI